MKLLFDENISFRIIKKIDSKLPACIHVSKVGLGHPPADREIWDYAKRNNYLIVTFDEDFQDLANVYGFPPKVILLRTGNSSTQFIADILLDKISEVREFEKSEVYGLLEIF